MGTIVNLLLEKGEKFGQPGERFKRFQMESESREKRFKS